MSRQDAAAYRSGSASFRKGIALEANPYNATMHAHHCWKMGWINAKLKGA